MMKSSRTLARVPLLAALLPLLFLSTWSVHRSAAAGGRQPEVAGKPAPDGKDDRTAEEERDLGPPRLNIRDWTVNQALILPGESVGVRVTAANEGGGVLQGVTLEAEADEGLEIIKADSPGPADLVARPEVEGKDEKGQHEVSDELDGYWEVRPTEARMYWLHVSATDAEGNVDRLDIPIAATRMPPAPPRIAVEVPRVRTTADHDFIFENRHFTAVLIRNVYGYGPLLYYPNAPKGRPRPPMLAAVTAPISRAVWQEGSGRMRIADIYPETARIINGRPAVHLESTVKEAGQTFRFATDLQVERNPWMSAEYELKPVQTVDMLHFSGPMVRVGEGDQGVSQREALFPGLEFLGVDDESSSGENDDTPTRNRVAPDPFKITVPAMSVAQEDTLVGILWEPRQLWDGHDQLPAAVFDSPNFLEDQNNSLMGLFAPGIPQYVPENHIYARKPYRLTDKQSFRLNAKVVVQEDERDTTFAIRLWARAFGEPKGPARPRDFEAERAVSRRAFTETLWDPDARGWHYALPVEESPEKAEEEFPAEAWAGPVVALLMDAALEKGATGQELLDQADEVVEALRDQGPLPVDLAYRVGGVPESLNEVRDDVREIMASQHLSGAWFIEGEETDITSPTPPRLTEIGYVAERAVRLLRYAAMTGDPGALAAGYGALMHLEFYRIPRGGNLDDFPLRAPDLLAATYAAEAHALGYLLTDRQEFLRRAQYWADAGLAFTYFWHHGGRDAMAFATVPAFAADEQGRSWIGVANQNVGLQFAYVLRFLHRLQDDPLYERVSSGIVTSGMYQQEITGEYAGLIPHRWPVYENRGEGPWINPENLLAALYAVEGYEMRLAFERTRVRGSDRLFITNPHRIESLYHGVSGLRVRVKSPGAMPAYMTVADIEWPVNNVRFNDERLPEFELDQLLDGNGEGNGNGKKDGKEPPEDDAKPDPEDKEKFPAQEGMPDKDDKNRKNDKGPYDEKLDGRDGRDDRGPGTVELILDEPGWVGIPERSMILILGKENANQTFRVAFRRPVRSRREQQLAVPWIPRRQGPRPK